MLKNLVALGIGNVEHASSIATLNKLLDERVEITAASW